MVGNGVTNWKFDCTPAYFHMSYYHGLISDDLYNNVNQNCNLTYFDAPTPPVQSDQCTAWLEKFGNLTTLVNIYDIFGKCYQDPGMQSSVNKNLKEVSDSEVAQTTKYHTAKQLSSFLGQGQEKLKVIPPCIYATPILDYFHNTNVTTQLNVSPKAAMWDLCTTDFNYTGSENATQWIYPIL